MMFTTPYEAYAAGNMAGNPMQLVIALYEGGISAVQEAQRCFVTGDILARSNAVTKGINILAELQISLNHDKAEAKELSANLEQLYGYMQQRLLAAHMQKTPEPLVEVEGLLRTMLESWYAAAKQQQNEALAEAEAQVADYSEPEVIEGEDDVLRISYGGYYSQPVESYSALAYSF